MDGNIKVVYSDSPFLRVAYSIINDIEIDVETLGLYVKIMSLGSKWNCNIGGLSTSLNLSTQKVRKSIGLLERKGYVRRIPVRNERGQLNGWDYIFYQEPVSDITNAGRPTYEETDLSEIPQDGKTDISETDLSENRQHGNTEGHYNNIYKDNNIYNNNKIDNNNNIKVADATVAQNHVSSSDVDFIYSLYPTKDVNNNNRNLHKCQKCKNKIAGILTKMTVEELEKKVRWYVKDCATKKAYMQNFETFLNQLPDDETMNDVNDINDVIDDTYRNYDGSYSSPCAPALQGDRNYGLRQFLREHPNGRVWLDGRTQEW